MGAKVFRRTRPPLVVRLEGRWERERARVMDALAATGVDGNAANKKGLTAAQVLLSSSLLLASLELSDTQIL